MFCIYSCMAGSVYHDCMIYVCVLEHLSYKSLILLPMLHGFHFVDADSTLNVERGSLLSVSVIPMTLHIPTHEYNFPLISNP